MPTTEPVEIPVEAIDQATGTFNDVGKAMVKLAQKEKDLAANTEAKKHYEQLTQAQKDSLAVTQKSTFSFTELNSAVSLVKQGYQAVSGVVKDVYGSFSEAAESTRDLALASGTTATEASTLLQVLDDYQISAQDVTAASKAMKEKGLVPTLETLAQLSDQFLAIEDPAERLQFAQDNLGKSYSKYLNVLQQGGDTLRENATQVNKNLILSDEQIESYEEQRLALDAYSDTIEGAKVAMGAWVGSLIQANEQGKENIERLQQLDDISGKTAQNYRFLTDEQKATVAQLERGEAMTKFYNAQLEATADIIKEDTVPSIEDVTKANQEYLDSIGAMSDVVTDHKDNLADLNSQYQEETAKLVDLTKTRWWDTAAIDAQKAKIDELRGKMEEETADYELNSKRRILAGVEEQLAKDGLTEQEKVRLEELGVAWGIYTEEAIAKAQAERKAVDDIATAINNLPEGKDITVTLNAVANVPGAIAGDPQAQAGGYAYQYGNQGYADGGISRGPMSGHTETLHGDEAVIPLKNGSVPVQIQKTGGNNDMSNIMPFIERMGSTIARSIRDELQKAGRR